MKINGFQESFFFFQMEIVGLELKARKCPTSAVLQWSSPLSSAPFLSLECKTQMFLHENKYLFLFT